MEATRADYDEVYVYAMGQPAFMLQHVVDAVAVQAANTDIRPISIVFGLVGLYLYIEKQFSGRQVQKAHMVLGHRRRHWPAVCLPEDRGTVTVVDVSAAPAGVERDLAIEAWCRSVWTAFEDNRQMVVSLLREYHVI